LYSSYISGWAGGNTIAQYQGVRRNLYSTSGFTLVDMVFVMAIIAILSAIAVPGMQDIADSMVLGEAARQVRAELQQAKLLAVTTNRPMRVRFNCPLAGDYRITELIGTPTKPVAMDTATTRCSEQLFPYPAPDINPLTRPNHDGPVRKLDQRVTFGPVQTIEFWPDGTARIDQGVLPWSVITGEDGLALTLIKGTVVKTVTVNGLGKITSN
jgi:prepilin-type N-terminal cleavage/methylation domain-containing protein